jgi:hypothetical protein
VIEKLRCAYREMIELQTNVSRFVSQDLLGDINKSIAVTTNNDDQGKEGDFINTSSS